MIQSNFAHIDTKGKYNRHNLCVNIKNVMYLNISYVLMLHYMIKLRPDLESAQSF